MPVTAINHYLVVSKNLERSKQFYQEVLGLELASGLISVFPATG
jgi:catechol 2,3-dioxygenase-like lactoylglutathione lyase family enzyme